MRNHAGATGLLQKAAKLRADRGIAPTRTGTAPADDIGAEAGINAEDRREILEAIEQVARSNRISAAPSALEAKPRHRGLAFPLVVNLVALALTALLLFVINRSFAVKDTAAAREGGAISTAEGKLIQELKRESESRLREKDKAIEEAKGKLAALDKERSDLASSMESRIAEREASLKATLAAELEKERARLTAQGLAEAAIQEKLAKFESERRAAYDRELEAFRRQAKAESDAAEARYAGLRDEYNATLANLAGERRRIQDESKRREDELRASMEAQAKELESRSAEASAGLEKARAELAKLEDQRKRDAAVEERLLGLYAVVRTALRERRFEAAAAGADALSAYLDDPTVSKAPSLQARREADLFAARALGDLARSELARSGADATKLLRQAELLQAATEASAAADRALRLGDASTAQSKYREALEKVPAILAAHEYFLGRLRDEEAVRRARLSEAVAQAQAAQRAGDAQAAQARYIDALAYLPLDEAGRREAVSRMGQIGSILSDAARRASETSAAREPLAAAGRSLSASKWAEALRAYLAILAQYPSAEQSAAASAGAEAALAGLARESETRAAADAASLAALRSDAERLGAESSARISGLEADKAKLASDAETREAKVAELERLLAESRAETAAAAAQARAAPPAATAAAQAGDQAALAAEVQRLSAVAAKFDAIAATYAAYAKAEDSALAGGGPKAMVEAQSALDSFLDGPEARSAMPGLRERIARYERAYQEAGQREVLYNAVDLVDGALRAKDAAARSRYFAELEARYAGDKAMSDFIAGLKKSLR